MKRLWIYLIVLALCLAGVAGAIANASEMPGDTAVYVTGTGTKYHRDGCSYLESKSRTTKRAAEAAGYEPCSRCNPDVKAGTYTSDWNGKSGNRKPTSSTGEWSEKPVPTKEVQKPFTEKVREIADKLLVAIACIAATLYFGWIAITFTRIILESVLEKARDFIQKICRK